MGLGPWTLTLVALTLVAPLLADLPAHAAREARVADNVFVVRDKEAKTISAWLIVKAGYADEPTDAPRGIAHYLEHLLFLGRGPDQGETVVRIIPEGSGNGTTNARTTTYFQRFPSRPETDAENLDKVLRYLVGHLVPPKAGAEEAARERTVVLQEYQLNYARNPMRRFGLAINTHLYRGEPLENANIGTPEGIRSYTLEAARAFHETWYHRNNSYLVVSGPVEPDHVRDVAAKHLDLLPHRPVPAHPAETARPVIADAILLRQEVKDQRQVAVTFDRVVSYEEGNAGGARAAREVLNGYFASRLKGAPLTVLMDQNEVLLSGGMSVQYVRAGTLRFSFSGVPAEGVAPEQLAAAVGDYIERLAREGLSADTVARLKRRIAEARALDDKQPARVTDQLVGWLSAHLPYADRATYRGAQAGVTPDSVRALLAAVAGPGRQVTSILTPAKETADGSPAPAAGGAPTSKE